ncbi:hypothetical protein BDZ85DRAFT_259819 [Elsinoe ampelina]|uniref:WD40-repeat-containing domain protein n=1 Tax=Elsinoe ampelina TaxID=302913 RepID=A0A6A6GHR5_9PEZI|nr:hypothetical protein BDZ85DRAFT_259819 [Elsinoe ampelina]
MLNGQKIPGFYWDPDRQKYFQIQPNHRAPPGLKHSVQNVRREEQAAKRQKLQYNWEQKVYNETARKSSVLKFHHTQIGLGRELGLQPVRQAEVARSRAFAYELSPDHQICFQKCENCKAPQRIGDFSLWNEGRSIVAGLGNDVSSIITMHHDLDKKQQHPNTFLRGIASNVNTLHVTDDDIMVATSTTPKRKNVFIARLARDDPQMYYHDPVTQMQVGGKQHAIEDCALQPGPNPSRAAIGLNNEKFVGQLTIIDIERGSLIGQTMQCNSEVRSVDWLNQNTVIEGMSGGSVMLYDVRAHSDSPRFKHGSATVSVRSQGDGHSIWAACQESINLHDVRMSVMHKGSDLKGWLPPQQDFKYGGDVTLPVLTIPFHEKRSTVNMAIWHGTGMLAYNFNHEFCLRLHSLADGSFVRQQMAVNIESEVDALKYWNKNLKSGYDERGVPVLYYAHGSTIQSLRYGRERLVQDVEAWGEREFAVEKRAIGIREEMAREALEKATEERRKAREAEEERARERARALQEQSVAGPSSRRRRAGRRAGRRAANQAPVSVPIHSTNV